MRVGVQARVTGRHTATVLWVRGRHTLRAPDGVLARRGEIRASGSMAGGLRGSIMGMLGDSGWRRTRGAMQPGMHCYFSGAHAVVAGTALNSAPPLATLIPLAYHG